MKPTDDRPIPELLRVACERWSSAIRARADCDRMKRDAERVLDQRDIEFRVTAEREASYRAAVRRLFYAWSRGAMLPRDSVDAIVGDLPAWRICPTCNGGGCGDCDRTGWIFGDGPLLGHPLADDPRD